MLPGAAEPAPTLVGPWACHTASVLVLTALAAVAAAAWVVLVAGRGGFWLVRPRLPSSPPPPSWPSVAIVVPARDEAAVLPETLPLLLTQHYPGRARVVVVDDQSTDGTADVAASLAAHGPTGALDLTVVSVPPRPAGWVGKLWAVHHGVLAAGDVDWVLCTDADIAHPPGSLTALVAAAEDLGVDEVSLMARLRTQTGWERLLVPAFVHFFAMLYPFRWVPSGRPRRAAAAGGCALVRRSTLERAGGVAAIRDAVIDDVALAQLLTRAGGRVWLGHGDRVRSVRPYGDLRSLWAMVARSAYTQLRCSLLALAGTVAGLVLVFVVPVAAVVVGAAIGDWPAVVLGGGAWLLMAATYLPMQRYLELPWWRALTLPVAAVLYTAMTVDSTRRHLLGRGPTWKGRHLGTGTHRTDNTR
jgi:hopene-associated glycosyltransferase HpnB